SHVAPPPLPDFATPVEDDTNAFAPANTPPAHFTRDRTERDFAPAEPRHYPPPDAPAPLPVAEAFYPGPPPERPLMPPPLPPRSRRRRMAGLFGLSKPVWYALMGGLGCLVAAMLFEVPLRLLLPASSTTSGMIGRSVLKADIVFVLDITASMDAY